jgi:hypothetical protein
MTRSNGARQSTGEEKRGMLKNRQNSLARTGAQTGVDRVKYGVALWPFTCPRRQLYSLSFSHRMAQDYQLELHHYQFGTATSLELHPLQSFPQCKGLRREPARKAF